MYTVDSAFLTELGLIQNLSFYNNMGYTSPKNAFFFSILLCFTIFSKKLDLDILKNLKLSFKMNFSPK